MFILLIHLCWVEVSMLKVWTAMRKLYKTLSVLALSDIKLVNTKLMSLLHLGHWTIQFRSLLMELHKAEALSPRGHGDNSRVFPKATMETISRSRTVSFCSNTFSLPLPNPQLFKFFFFWYVDLYGNCDKSKVSNEWSLISKMKNIFFFHFIPLLTILVPLLPIIV